MKLQLFAVLLVVAGSYALPQANRVVEPSTLRNPVENRIRRVIERIIMIADNAGLDPLEVGRRDFDINLESLDLAVKGFVDNVRFSGASDIRINTLEYSYFFNRLRLDVSLPEISLSVVNGFRRLRLKAIVACEDIEGQLKVSLSIKTIRIAGVGYVNVNIIGAISLRSVSLNCGIGGIESDLRVVALAANRSEFVNSLLNEKIPNFLDDKKDDINSALEIILRAFLNIIWGL